MTRGSGGAERSAALVAASAGTAAGRVMEVTAAADVFMLIVSIYGLKKGNGIMLELSITICQQESMRLCSN
jgi:hypothetical protein